jgi:hypothetical protein
VIDALNSEMAVDAARHRIGRVADSFRRLSGELKVRHLEIRRRALRGVLAPQGTVLVVAGRSSPGICSGACVLLRRRRL